MAATETTTGTSRARSYTVAAAVVVAALVAAGIAWAAPDRSSDPAPNRFWQLVSGTPLEVDPPDDVDEVTQRADTIVVAHVTAVLDGRQDPGSVGTTPAEDGTALPRTTFVQLTVDRVVKGSVAESQVLKLELYPPASQLGLAAARESMPQEKLLFFLHDAAVAAKRAGLGALAVQQEKGIYSTVSSKGVVTAGADGLELALRRHDPDVTYLRSFGAATVEGAAERASQAVR